MNRGSALTLGEWRRDGFLISTDPSRLDVDLIHQYLSEQAYWAMGRSRQVVERSIAPLHRKSRSLFAQGGSASGPPGSAAAVEREEGIDRRRHTQA